MWGSQEGLALEAGESAQTGNCPDCNASGSSVWGYVSKSGKAHAAYFALWVDKHPERGLQLLIGVGQWGEGRPEDLRKMAGLECRFENGRPSYMLVDADRLLLDELKQLGRGLKRQEVLSDAIKDEVFLLADHITYSDPRIKKFLSGSKA